MRFDERVLEEIKSRVRLSDVIGKTVKRSRPVDEYIKLYEESRKSPRPLPAPAARAKGGKAGKAGK